MLIVIRSHLYIVILSTYNKIKKLRLIDKTDPHLPFFKYFAYMLCTYVQWKPLNVITLGQR